MPVIYELNNDFSLAVYDSVKKLPAQWSALTKGESLFFSKDYLAALETSEHENFNFIYCLVSDSSGAVAALYFQVIDLSDIKITSVIQSEPYGKFLKLASDKISHSLFGKKKDHFILVNGNMCASGEFGLLVRPDRKEIFAGNYIQIIERIKDYLSGRGEISVYIIKDFDFRNDFILKQLRSADFTRFVMDPVMILHVENSWFDFNDYLKAVSAKYRLRAVNAIEKTSRFELKELQESDIDLYAGEIDLLYQAVIEKSPVRLVHPDIQYIYQLKKKLKNHFIVKAWFSNNRPVAFFTAIISHHVAYAHHIGIDYHLNRQHALYQNILYKLIEIAIINKCSLLDYGRTALEMKSTTGAEPVHFSAYIKMNNRVLNHLIRPFLPTTPPANWIQRDPYRKEQ